MSRTRFDLATLLEQAPESEWTNGDVLFRSSEGATYACAFGVGIKSLGYRSIYEYENSPKHEDDWGCWRDFVKEDFDLNQRVPIYDWEEYIFGEGANLGYKIEIASDLFGYKAAAHVARHPHARMAPLVKKYGFK